jgi:SGNH domain (fused to AT3 domains)
MRHRLSHSLRLLKTAVIVAAAISLATSAEASAQTRSSASVKSAGGYATLAQVQAAIKSAQHMSSPPAHVTPTLSALASLDDWGGDLQASSSCPSLDVNAATFDVASCTFGDKTATSTVALVGDSRAQMWLDTFNTLGLSQHFKLVFMAKNGCPVPLGSYQTNNNGTVSKATWSACTSFHSFVASTLKSLNPAAIVVSSNYELELANPPHLASPKEVKADTVKFLESLPKTSKTVVLGGFPQPADTANPTLCLSKGPKQISSCNFVPSHTVDAENAAAQSAASTAGVAFINQTPWFCASTCPAIVASIIPYTIDAYHGDKTYLNYLAGVLWSSLKPYVQ